VQKRAPAGAGPGPQLQPWRGAHGEQGQRGTLEEGTVSSFFIGAEIEDQDFVVGICLDEPIYLHMGFVCLFHLVLQDHLGWVCSVVQK